MHGRAKVIAQIEERMVELIESLTQHPELRQTGKLLAREFSEQKLNEGLEAAPSDVDIEATARLILKRQIRVLYENRDEFTPMEILQLQELAKLIAKL